MARGASRSSTWCCMVDRPWGRMLSLGLVVAGLHCASASAATVVNGSAEDSPPAVPGWTGSGIAAVAYAEASQNPNTSGAGSYLFRSDTGIARIAQTLDFAAFKEAIDSGAQRLTLEGDFGGSAGEDAALVLTMTFLSETASELGTANVGGPPAAQRTADGTTLACARVASVPVGTRSVRLELAATGGAGGTADRLRVSEGASPPNALPGQRFTDTGCFRPQVVTPPPPPQTERPDDPGHNPGNRIARAAPALRTLLRLPAQRCIRSSTVRVTVRPKWQAAVRALATTTREVRRRWDVSRPIVLKSPPFGRVLDPLRDHVA